MKSITKLLVCCAVLNLVACSNMPRPQNYSTALGETRQQLQPDPKWSDGSVWVRPGPSIGTLYDKKIILEPVQYIAGDRPDDLNMKSNATLRESALAYLNQSLQHEFSQAGYTLITAPEPRALRVRVAITATFRNDRDPRVFEYLPVGFVINQATKAAGYRNQSIRLLVEGTVRDASTDELLIASLGASTGRNIDPDAKPIVDDIRSAIDDWTRHTREQFDRIWTAK